MAIEWTSNEMYFTLGDNVEGLVFENGGDIVFQYHGESYCIDPDDVVSIAVLDLGVFQPMCVEVIDIETGKPMEVTSGGSVAKIFVKKNKENLAKLEKLGSICDENGILFAKERKICTDTYVETKMGGGYFSFIEIVKDKLFFYNCGSAFVFSPRDVEVVVDCRFSLQITLCEDSQEIIYETPDGKEEAARFYVDKGFKKDLDRKFIPHLRNCGFKVTVINN